VHLKLDRAGLCGVDVGMDDGVCDRLADGERDALAGFCGGAGGGGRSRRAPTGVGDRVRRCVERDEIS
jgi:hypothetical protein